MSLSIESAEEVFASRAAAVCPSCGRRGLQEFARVENVPVHNSLVLSDAASARAFPRGDVAIALCEGCGFITSTAFDPAKIHYDPNYEDQQSFSPTFNAFARSLASDLIERYNLRGKSVLEIGCGKGDFLALMCELGAARGTGIDPTAVQGRLTSAGSERIRLISELYSERHAGENGDFICCRHTLEHIPDTAAFLRTIRRAIGDRSTPFFLEVPDTMRVLKECAYWDVYYEHCSYFTPGSLVRLFRHCGFDVVDCRLGCGAPYILRAARPASLSSPDNLEQRTEAFDTIEETRAAAAWYGQTLRRTLASWREWFEARRRADERVAIWGSGSKCVSFLTTLGLGEDPAFADRVRVVDINPHRHGKFLLGSGIEIEGPESLHHTRPDHVVIMNPIYLDEIQAMLKEMQLDCEVTTV